MLGKAVRAAPDGVTYAVDPARIRGHFYQDCSDEIVAYAAARLCAEPILPQSTPLPALTRWPGVEKHYIRCEQDQTIPPEYQATMADGFPKGCVTGLPTSHSPFFSAPGLLAERLGRIASGG